MAQAIIDRETPAEQTATAPTPRPSWNPLRCDGTALPPNLLLWAKAVGLLLLGMGYVGEVPEPFLPLFGLPYGLPDLTQWVLQGIILTAIGLLLVNRAVRVCCVTIAATLFIAMASNRLYYSNAKTFVMVIMLIIGLYDGRITHTLLRWQYALMYAGAAVNKLFDADWRNGMFFDHWMGVINDSALFDFFNQFFTGRTLGLLLSWMSIGIETILAVLLLIPRPRIWLMAILLAVGFHGVSVIMADTLFRIYVPALALGLTTFFAWPRQGEMRLTAPAGSRLLAMIKRADLDGLVASQPAQTWSLQTPHTQTTGQWARGLAVVYLPMFWWVMSCSVASIWLAYLKLRTMV